MRHALHKTEFFNSIISHILAEKIPHSTEPKSPTTVCCEHLGRYCWRLSQRVVHFAYAFECINSFPAVNAHFTIKSGEFVCVRCRTFFLARLLNLEFEGQRKRIWCDAADVFFQKRIVFCLSNVTYFIYFSTAAYFGRFRPPSS